MQPLRRIAAALAAVATVLVVASAGPAAACSGFVNRIDLDRDVDDGEIPFLAEAIDRADRLVRVEVVATSPRAHDFVRGGVVVGTDEWGVEPDDARPLTLIIDDGRDLTDENDGCWFGRDIEPEGTTFVIAVHEDPDYVAWTIVGDDARISEQLGEPTPLPRDDAEVGRLRDELDASRGLAARLRAYLPFDDMILGLIAVTAALAIWQWRRSSRAADAEREIATR